MPNSEISRMDTISPVTNSAMQEDKYASGEISLGAALLKFESYRLLSAIKLPNWLLFSDSETEGLLSKRLAEFKKMFNMGNQAHLMGQIKPINNDIITTDQRFETASSVLI